MASKVGRLLPQTRNLAHAATNPAEAAVHKFVKPEAVRSSKLSNGLSVVSIENYAPISKFAVYVRAGARFEPADQLGISHAMRLAAGLTTQRSSIFAITRNIEYLGGNLTASTTREHLIYELQANRDHNEQTLQYLSDVICRPAFKHWELEDYQYRFKVELERLAMDPQAQLVEALHRAAFRGGLANSLYTPEYNVGKHGSDSLHAYQKQHFTPSNIAIVGVGVEHEQLAKFVEEEFSTESSSSQPNQSPSKFIGSDVRLPRKGPLAFTAVVSEGPSAQNTKEVLALAALHQLLGYTSRVKYSNGAGRLALAASKVAKQPFQVAPVLTNYSDSGLFGFSAVTDGSETHAVVKAIVTELRNTVKNLNESDATTAKNQLLAAAYQFTEQSDNLLHKLGESALIGGQFGSQEDIISQINSLTLKDIQAAAAKVIKGKVAIASVGQIGNTPYAEDLV